MVAGDVEETERLRDAEALPTVKNKKNKTKYKKTNKTKQKKTQPNPPSKKTSVQLKQGCGSGVFQSFPVYLSLRLGWPWTAQREHIWPTVLEPGCVNVGYTSLLSMPRSCAFNVIGFLAC